MILYHPKCIIHVSIILEFMFELYFQSICRKFSKVWMIILRMSIHQEVKHPAATIRTIKWFIIWNFLIPLTWKKINDLYFYISKAPKMSPVWLESVNRSKPKNDVHRHDLNQLIRLNFSQNFHRLFGSNLISYSNERNTIHFCNHLWTKSISRIGMRKKFHSKILWRNFQTINFVYLLDLLISRTHAKKFNLNYQNECHFARKWKCHKKIKSNGNSWYKKYQSQIFPNKLHIFEQQRKKRASFLCARR